MELDGGTHATSSPKNLIFLWQVSRRERREETVELVAAPWWTGVGGADRVEDVEAEESWRTTRAGERSIAVVVIVVVEDDLFGAPSSCPRIFSRTLGMHQILFGSHRTPAATPIIAWCSRPWSIPTTILKLHPSTDNNYSVSVNSTPFFSLFFLSFLFSFLFLFVSENIQSLFQSKLSHSFRSSKRFVLMHFFRTVRCTRGNTHVVESLSRW